MRILLVTNLFPPDVLGGYELLAADVVNGLRKRDHSVVVLTTGEARADDPDWVRRSLDLVRPFGEPPSLDRWRHIWAARKQARVATQLAEETRAEVALFMSLRRLGLHIPRAFQAAGLPAAYCFNDDWLLAHRPANAATATKRFALGLAERGPFAAQTWKGVDIRHAVFVSENTRQSLTAGGAPLSGGEVCWQGVDLDHFRPRPFRPVPRAVKLLYTGRVHPTKGIDLAIRALAVLRQRGLEATLSIAGTGDEEELTRLRELSVAEGVDGAVDWLGFISRETLPDTYRDHDVFVFPSTWKEPAGLTYLEAMACGVPVVALARGGAKELLSDSVNAVVVEDHEGMASGIERLVTDPALTRRVVTGGEETVRQQASLDRYVSAIEAQLTAAMGTEGASEMHQQKGDACVGSPESRQGPVYRRSDLAP